MGMTLAVALKSLATVLRGPLKSQKNGQHGWPYHLLHNELSGYHSRLVSAGSFLQFG